MNGTGCKTDDSVITMRNDTCHAVTVLGRQEGVGRTTKYGPVCALFKGAAVAQPQANCCPPGKWAQHCQSGLSNVSENSNILHKISSCSNVGS